MILLLLQLLFFPVLLIMYGEPVRFFLLRKLGLFSDLDFVQICILDVYVGGLILYAIAILPFAFFNQFVMVGLTVLFFFVSVNIHSKMLAQVTGFSKIRALLKANRRILLDYLPLFAMFLTLLLIDLSASSGLVFGGIFDESIHSLRTEVIIQNSHIGLTLQPYLPEANIYPEASHVIFAFATYVLNMMVPKAVFYISILFKALTVFGAYFLGRMLSSRREYYLGLSFVFTFISQWPLFVVWGGNPFLVGLPLFLVCLGLLFSLIRSQTKTSLAELAVLGLLFGLAGAMVVSFLETLTVVALMVFVYWLVSKHNSLRHRLLELIVILSVSLLVLSPFLVRFFVFYQYPGHNIGIPSDFAGYPKQESSLTQAVQWAFNNLSPYFGLRLLMMVLFVGLAMLVWINRAFNKTKSVLAFASSICLAAATLSFIAYLLPGDFEIISWGHQGLIIVIALNVFLLAFFLELAQLFRSHRFGWLSNLSSKFPHANMMLAVLLIVLITAPFAYYRISTDTNSLRVSYGTFAVTTQDDYNLMTWMKENLSSNAVILVSLYEPGLFIPVISHHIIVYPYSASSFSRSYQTLLDSLDSNVLNVTSYDLMQNLSISHVYVGSNGAYWLFKKYKWDPLLFLGNPNFKLVENIGVAYLFQFTYMIPSVAFTDDFEDANWSATGWEAKSAGTGQGNVTTTTDFAYNSQSSLKMTAQAAYTLSEWQCATYISRKIYVLNDSDVSLSFYVNATEGFSGRDTFGAIVSNLYGNQTYVITTPNGVYENYQHSKSLPTSEGFYEFTGNNSMSTLWHQAYNSSLPNPFILQFVSWDFDGVQNVAYLDNITVTTSPGQ